jgi:uncharacterized protein YdcH (DUF465 family)
MTKRKLVDLRSHEYLAQRLEAAEAKNERLRERAAALDRALTTQNDWQERAEVAEGEIERLREAALGLLDELFGENVPLLLAGEFDKVPDLTPADISLAKALAEGERDNAERQRLAEWWLRRQEEGF